MFNWLTCDNNNAQPSAHGTSPWTWRERAAARPQSLSITLQVREKYQGPHHAALRAHVTTVWQRGGHPRQAASRNLGMTATLIKRCQDPTLPPAEWQRRTKLTCRRLLRASSGVVNYVTSYTKHIILKKKYSGCGYIVGGWKRSIIRELSDPLNSNCPWYIIHVLPSAINPFI